MHLLCPHCHNPIELVELRTREEILCPSCGSSFRLESSTQALPNKQLGRFESLNVLASGAFGNIDRARDGELDRLVAVKVPLRSNVGDNAADRDRFIREARSIAQLRHPAIVAIHEVGSQEDTPYLVSDFIDGVTLADWLSAKRPSFR